MLRARIAARQNRNKRVVLMCCGPKGKTIDIAGHCGDLNATSVRGSPGKVKKISSSQSMIEETELGSARVAALCYFFDA